MRLTCNLNLISISFNISLEHVTVDCNLTAINERHTGWIIDIYNKLKTEDRDIIVSGFTKSGVSDAIGPNFDLNENPFTDLLNQCFILALK